MVLTLESTRMLFLVSAAFVQVSRTQDQKSSGSERAEGLKEVVSGGANAFWKSVRGSSLTLHCSI